MLDKQCLQDAIGFQVELELQDTYVSILRVTGIGESASSNIKPCLPSGIASGRTSSCTDTTRDEETYTFTGLSAPLANLPVGADFKYAILKLLQKIYSAPSRPEACYI